MEFRSLLGKQLLFFDGGMGTMLQSAGLAPGEAPDLWNISHPEAVREIHAAYLAAGCNILCCNTFGCNALKLAGSGHTPGEIAAAAVKLAREAIDGAEGDAPRFAALDIGPSGKLLAPLGDLSFEGAYDLFAGTIRAGAAAGADLILIETMGDLYELKAAVLAAKENCDLPVCATVTMDSRGRLLTGGDAACVVALLEGLGVDALGLNCGLGPREMLPLLTEILNLSGIPVILTPNAGIPRDEDGNTVFDVEPEEFAALMAECAKQGAWLLGGCCGTTPAHMAALIRRCAGVVPPAITPKTDAVACSYGRAVFFGGGHRPVIVGERINPTGKPGLREALKNLDYDHILREGIRQQEQQADALAVNAGMPEIDEANLLPEIVTRLQAVTDLPLVIDSADPVAMERALRLYNGKAIINSVNGKESAMSAIFPLVKRYGGVVIALTLDEDGIPEDAEGRIAIAKRILARGAEYGIPAHALLFDPLTMAVSAGPENPLVTLECVRRLHDELGVRTSLGVSNVSFGMPERSFLNGAFLTLALAAGLSAAILNPHAAGMMAAYRATRALLMDDPQCADYIAAYGWQSAAGHPVAQVPSVEMGLSEAVLRGLAAEARAAAGRALENRQPMEVIETALIPALNRAGARFEAGTLFLPQLLMCAEAAKAAFEVVKGRLGDSDAAGRGVVVIATVQGDVHDIGKNIVKALLENYRFQVVDLGKDVPPEAIVEAAESHDAKLVALSALMTTTVPAMASTIELLRKRLPGCKAMVGGAVLTPEYAARIGADHYSKDAMGAVRYACTVYPG